MSGFFIKNISSYPLSVLGATVYPKTTLDLLTVATGPQIVASLMNGQLFDQLQGKIIAVFNVASFYNIGATQDQINFFASCGFLQDKQADAVLRSPLAFTADGYLKTEVYGITLDAGDLTVDIRGDKVIPAERDSVLVMGTEDGTINTTTHVAKIGADLKLQVADGYVLALTKLEDAAHVSGDPGIEMLRVRRDVPVSSAGSDGDYVTGNQDADGFDYVRDKAYDAASNANRTFEVAPIWSRNVQTPVAIIGVATNLAATFTDLGPEIALQGYTRLGLWLNITINTSTNVRVRCLAKHTSAGIGEYALPITAVDVSGVPFNAKVQAEYIELDADISQYIILKWEIDNFIPFCQMQIMAEVLGATPAQITDAYVTFGYGG